MDKKLPIAYFCAEFGIESSIPTYAGGLGILAGDTLREAADIDFPIVGIGLMYQGRFFTQKILDNGWQTEEPSQFDPDESTLVRPVSSYGKPVFVIVNLAGIETWIKAYQLRVGDNITLYFVSCDNDKNSREIRNVMAADYYGDEENQIRQQIILSIGGVRLLKALKIKPRLYHLNEGRACFTNWEVTKNIIEKEHLGFNEAKQKAKNLTVYTNHTILGSGNPTYSLDLIKKYALWHASKMNVSSDELVHDGVNDKTKRFDITQFALNTSKIASAVSKPHGRLLKKTNPNYNWVTITNGVNMPQWQYFEFANSQLSASDIWNVHRERKFKLAEIVLKRTGFGYDANRLVVSWARRVSDYKQPHSIFEDIDRLTTILKNQQRPVQLLFAGKAHVGDDTAKKIIQEIILFMQNELSGNAIFVHNYNIALAKELVTGSDVWLNTPEFGKEACGTSGMKAIANGVLNCTTPDGWANEVKWDGIGWKLDAKNVAESFYSLMENEIVPLFYNRTANGLPIAWIERMRKSISLSRKFSTRRMLDEYIKKLYS